VPSKIAGLINPTPGRIRSILSKLPGIGRTISAGLSNAFSTVKTKVSGFLSGVPGRVRSILAPLGGIARSAATSIGNAFSGIVGKIAGHFSGVASAIGSHLSGAAGAARNAASDIVSAFAGLAGRIVNAVGSIVLHPHISWPSLHIPGTATGGVFEGLRGVGVPRTVGEAGPEAVVPLHRPLSQVDPSVRILSAIAQGKVPGMASGGIAGAGRVVSADPGAVSQRLLDKIVAAAY
jgi:Flp pilus assembly pilin Flp